ncbi:ATP-binding cassette domain-containing protein [Dactylosporangium vinaceum]|uniref:ATP-binding cassette domain-containing protein n=1 Tax=Dactylosporangium vinaceum TaxID=53362 RepID=A0ABV5M0C3_9ACTN|nr:ATP-binding cassette domain-containing protein [Dactylosporangium vinaceum]UAB97411.1 ATP-binding cassette domain-containing protein [Dactylosporangium vinaceum]
MSELRVRVDGNELRLSDTTPHPIRAENGRLRVGETADSEGFGYLVFEITAWFLYTTTGRRPAGLQLNGRPVTRLAEPLDDDDELTIADHPAQHTPARPSGQSKGPGRIGPGRKPEAATPKRNSRPRTLTIGRAGTGADIEIADPSVRTEHAYLEVDKAGRWWIREGAGRLFVDGKRVMTAVADVGTVFVVGQTALTVGPNLLSGGVVGPERTAPAASASSPAPALQISAGRGLAIDLDGVTVVRKGNTLLDDVSLHVGAGEVVAVVGPSGAGKSSLVKVLLGEHQPDRGVVRIGGAEAAGRHQVRYVPQADDLYDTLTVAETLTFAAGFRATPDARPEEIGKRVDLVLGWLSLAERRNDQIATLSGGQRRRVSIGLELVGEPQLLLLDEPTSGLDLGKDRDIMMRLQNISRSLHCTVVVVTHSVTHLEYVDKLVVMGRGGLLRYAGPPAAPQDEGYASWADWMVDLDAAPIRRPVTGARPAARRSMHPAAPPALSGRGFAQALLRETRLVIRRGRKSLSGLVALPFFGALLAAFASGDGLRPGPDMAQVLSILTTVAALTGAALTYLQLVHERAVLQRDWRVGISAGRLVSAKAFVYGAVSLICAALVTATFLTLRPGPPSAFGISPVLALFGAMALTMMSSMGLGLLISSFARTLEQAVTLNTMLAVVQVALNGALFAVPIWCTWFLPSRLGLGLIAAYADLNAVRPSPLYHDPLWAHGAVVMPLAVLGMSLIAGWSVVGAAAKTERGWRG